MKASILLLTLMSLFLVFSCKKYEDGPNFSLKSVESRLTGKWLVELAYYSDFSDKPENGEDQTAEWRKFSVEFNKDKTYRIDNLNWDNTETIKETGTWKFSDDKLKILTDGVKIVSKSLDPSVILSETTEKKKWRIMMLKNKSLWAWYQNQTAPPWVYFRMIKE